MPDLSVEVRGHEIVVTKPSQGLQVRDVADRGGLLLSGAGNALLSPLRGSASKQVGISTQAPPNGK